MAQASLFAIEEQKKVLTFIVLSWSCAIDRILKFSYFVAMI